MRLLLVEDDPLLGDGLQVGLTQAGYRVDWLQDGLAAGQALLHDRFDLAVLDLGLPGEDGLRVLRRLRERDDPMPVLILTARDSVQDRVAGLDAGADDYLVKPFNLDELTARLRAIQRRGQGRATPLIRYGDIELDPAGKQVTLAGQPVELTGREFAILQALLDSQGKVLTRERLDDLLYGWDEGAESNAIEVHIHHLRKKLGKDLIRTMRGVGYLMPLESRRA
jgi:two-component system, OmpR family, response regulator QseB